MHRFRDNITFATATTVQGGPKSGARTHEDHDSVKSEPIKFFFTENFLGKYVVKWILNLKLHPRLVCVVTLPCETLMSEKQAI